jgi:hypothetical protein
MGTLVPKAVIVPCTSMVSSLGSSGLDELLQAAQSSVATALTFTRRRPTRAIDNALDR